MDYSELQQGLAPHCKGCATAGDAVVACLKNWSSTMVRTNTLSAPRRAHLKRELVMLFDVTDDEAGLLVASVLRQE